MLVFAFNTAVGFACAVGLDMGFNTAQHHDEEATEIHVHENGEKHEHHPKASEHHHEGEKKEKGGCCNDTVIKIAQTDKSVPQSGGIVSPVFFTSFLISFYNSNIFNTSQVTGNIKYFVRSYHPPIPDIRIAIQSFQI